MTNDGNTGEVEELRATLAALETGKSSRKKAKSGCLKPLLVIGGLFVVVVMVANHLKPASPPPSPENPIDAAKAKAVFEARMLVPQTMRDPASAQFGQVWGMGSNLACGYVNGKNAFGALTGEQQFIFAMGSVEFADGSSKFAHHWNTLCVDKLLSTVPDGMFGHRWGSKPTSDLKPAMATTSDGLALFTPKAPPAPLDGVAVKEADYRYDHGRLYAADAYIDGDAKRDAIKAALTKTYGTPLASDDDAFSYGWKWPDRKVAIDMSYQASSHRTQVTIARGPY